MQADVVDVYEQENAKMPDGCQVKKGDIVICSVGGDFVEPCDLGIVAYVSPGTKLPNGHADGAVGDVFVQSYKNRRLRKQNLQALLGIYCFFVYSYSFVLLFISKLLLHISKTIPFVLS